jgi:hypothetical protein
MKAPHNAHSTANPPELITFLVLEAMTRPDIFDPYIFAQKVISIGPCRPNILAKGVRMRQVEAKCW